MSTIKIERGKENVIERTVHMPERMVDWNQTAIEFRVRTHREGIRDDSAHEMAGDVLVHKSTQTPPGGIEVIGEDRVRVVLEPSDTLELPVTADQFDWSLDFEPGAFNVFVLEYGLIEAT